jgi:hypothetical protein
LIQINAQSGEIGSDRPDRNAGSRTNVMTAKGASHHPSSSVRPFVPEVSMSKAPVAYLPVAAPNQAMMLQRTNAELASHEDPIPVASSRQPSSGMLEDASPVDTDDDLKPARGFINGVLLAVPLWGLIGVLTWLLLA